MSMPPKKYTEEEKELVNELSKKVLFSYRRIKRLDRDKSYLNGRIEHLEEQISKSKSEGMVVALTERINKLYSEFVGLYRSEQEVKSNIEHRESQISRLGNINTEEIINELKLEKRSETINKIIKTN